jgi:SLT domain-containing protein
MAAMTPAGSGPLSSLGGLASQLTTTPTTASADTTTQRRKATPGSVDAAIDAALDALGITDPAARARWHAGYDTLITRESSGNAYAVNRTDSNARGPIQADGAPAGSSRGLTQVTPENFARYRLPSLPNDIYHPVSNIAASMRYVMDRHHVDPSGINLTANVQQANRHLPARGY